MSWVDCRRAGAVLSAVLGIVLLVSSGCARFSAPAAWTVHGSPPPPPPPSYTPPPAAAGTGSVTPHSPPSHGQQAPTGSVPEAPVPSLSMPAVDPSQGGPPAPTQFLPFQAVMPPTLLPVAAPAMRFANLSPGQCQRRLKKAALPFKRTGGVRNVATALRFDGPLEGVQARAPGERSPFGVLDCRLALVMSELFKVLRAHDVVAMRIDNMYRPNSRFGSRRKRSQHAYGLAVDIFSFTFGDGQTLQVEESWVPKLGKPVCGPEASAVGLGASEIRLRNLVCDIARSGLFHHMLTPNFDSAHRNHFHFDIKRGVKSYSIS